MADSEEKKLVRRPARPRALRRGEAGFDARAKRQLRTRRRKIETARLREDLLTWQIGMHLLVIEDLKLYRQDGYSSFSDYVVRGLGRSRTWARDRMRVAKAYVLSHIRKYGLDILEDANRYAALTATDDDADWSPDTLELQVPIAGQVRTVPFRKASAADLEAALAHQLQLLGARLEAAIPEQARKGAEHVRRALKVPDSEEHLADLRVKAPGTGLVEDTRITMSLRYGDLRSVVTLLARALLGPGEQLRGRP